MVGPSEVRDDINLFHIRINRFRVAQHFFDKIADVTNVLVIGVNILQRIIAPAECPEFIRSVTLAEEVFVDRQPIISGASIAVNENDRVVCYGP